jgi:hypothetical protein
MRLQDEVLQTLREEKPLAPKHRDHAVLPASRILDPKKEPAETGGLFLWIQLQTPTARRQSAF